MIEKNTVTVQATEDEAFDIVVYFRAVTEELKNKKLKQGYLSYVDKRFLKNLSSFMDNLLVNLDEETQYKMIEKFKLEEYEHEQTKNN